MPNNTVGIINSFNTAGTVDGPGVRLVVFMQGCPLRCIYCHNPETWNFTGGQSSPPQDVVDKYLKNITFYKNGGITISGGEPFAQPHFLLDLVKLCKEYNIHVAVDTSGVYLDDLVKEILEYVDLVLLDVKFSSDEQYQQFVGISISPVLNFISYLSSTSLQVIVRQVIVTGYNDTEQSINATKQIIEELNNLVEYELLPFKKLCLEKYETLQIPFPLIDTPQTPLSVIEHLKAHI